MVHCPSRDWDRYIGEQDAAAEAEMAFYVAHRAEILQVACALIAGGRDVQAKNPEGGYQWANNRPVISGDVLRDAAELVRILNEQAGIE